MRADEAPRLLQKQALLSGAVFVVIFSAVDAALDWLHARAAPMHATEREKLAR